MCLNILREDWKPVLTINSVIYGLQYLFLVMVTSFLFNLLLNNIFKNFQEPNPEDPLNKEAADVLQNNKRLFDVNVQKAMRGGVIGNTYFEKCLK